MVATPFPRVPSVVGDNITKARSTLKEAGFGVTVKQQQSSKPKGTVTAQSPKGGTSAKPGRTINLVVAKPPVVATTASDDCTPGYSPCLIYHGGADYDCGGGEGDGPYRTVVGMTCRVTGSDP